MFSPIRAAACAAFVLLPSVLSAATLTATFDGDFRPTSWEGASGGLTAFVIEFDDTLGAQTGVLEGTEFLSFTWVNNPFTFGSLSARRVLLNAPTISGVVEAFRTPDSPGDPNPSTWAFGEGGGSSTGSAAPISAFTYEITGVTPPPDHDTAVVPLPASLPILASGLFGLLALGARKRRSA